MPLLVTPTPGKFYGPDNRPAGIGPIAYGPNAFGLDNAAQFAGITPFGNVVNRVSTVAGPKLVDLGFANTGVADPVSDPAIAGLDDFGNPLSFSDQYVDYLLGNNSGVLDPSLAEVRTCDL